MWAAGSWGLGILQLFQRSVRNFVRHGMPTRASALAYQGLFAVFPFVIFLGVLLVVFQADELFDRLIEQGRAQPPPQISGPLEPIDEQAQSSLLDQVLAPAVERLVSQGQEVAEGTLLPFGIVFLAIWAASGLAWTLLEALNAIHEVEETRTLWKRFSLSIIFAPIVAIMVIVGAGLLLIGPQLAQWIARWIGLDEAFVALWWFRFPLALLVLMLAVSTIYDFVPNIHRPFGFIMPGAVVAVILWALASLGFSFYLSNFANYGVVYGSLGAAVALLVYLYLSGTALLLGAEVNEAIYRRTLE
jgi:membrane protein